MNFLILFAFALIVVIECGEKVEKIVQDKLILDTKMADDLQKALNALPVDKIPELFKNPKDEK